MPDSALFVLYNSSALSCWVLFVRLGIAAGGALVVRTCCCWVLGAKVLRVEGKRASWEKEAGGSIYGHAGVCGQRQTRPSAVPVQARRSWLGVVVIKARRTAFKLCWERVSLCYSASGEVVWLEGLRQGPVSLGLAWGSRPPAVCGLDVSTTTYKVVM